MYSIVVLCSELSPQGTKTRSEHVKDHRDVQPNRRVRDKETETKKRRREDGGCVLGKREEKASEVIRYCVLNAP